MQKLSCENEFNFNKNKPVGGTHFHMVSHEGSFDTEAKGNLNMTYQYAILERTSR